MKHRLDPLRAHLPLLAAGGGWWLFAGSYVVFGVLEELGVPPEGWIPLGLILVALALLAWGAAAVLAVRDLRYGSYRKSLLALLIAVPPLIIVTLMLAQGLVAGPPGP